MDWSFGGLLKRARLEKRKTLRQRAIDLEMDAGNYSKLERGLLAPPSSKAGVNRLLKGLSLTRARKNLFYQTAYSFHLGQLQARFGATENKQGETNEQPT